jgi:hypothetical protein
MISKTLKDGPVIYQCEDSLLDKDRTQQNLTLAELNHILKLYLAKKNIPFKEISIIGQFSVIFNDHRLSEWDDLAKTEQNEALSDIVVLPDAYHVLIKKIGTAAGDPQIISSIVKDAYQNSIDSFSHAAFKQQKYKSRLPGFKAILFIDQTEQKTVLVVVDNGYGESMDKPKKSYLGEEYGNDLVSKFVEWLINRFEKEEKNIDPRIAYIGGQGMALKKIKIELNMDIDLHYFSSGAVFELRLKNYF